MFCSALCTIRNVVFSVDRRAIAEMHSIEDTFVAFIISFALYLRVYALCIPPVVMPLMIG